MPLFTYRDALILWRMNASVGQVMQYQVGGKSMIGVMRRWVGEEIGIFAWTSLKIILPQMSFELMESMRTLDTWISLHHFIDEPTFTRYTDCIRYNFQYVAGVGNYKLLIYLLQQVCKYV